MTSANAPLVFDIQVTRVTAVSQHQADSIACLTAEDDCSGQYLQLNARTLYCPLRSLFMEVGRETLQRIREGAAIRVAASQFS